MGNSARKVQEDEIVKAAGGLVWRGGRGGPKLALFWHMTADGESCFEPSDEIDRVKWLSPKDALERLKHPAERRLLRSVQVARVVRHLPR